MPRVTLSAHFRDRHVRLCRLRSPRGGGRANRTKGPGARRGSDGPRDALASQRGHAQAWRGLAGGVAAASERLVHPALRATRARLAETARRPRAPRARLPARGLLPDPLAAAPAPDQRSASAYQRHAAVLPWRPGRPRRAHLPDAQVPDAAPRRGGTARSLPRRRAGRAHPRRDDPPRPPAPRDAARRAPTALEHPARPHELRRAAPDPPALLRAARRRATGLLAAARGPARPHRIRAGAPRLRHLDGREARARPRVDRRPLGATLPADAGRDRVPRHRPVAPRSRPSALSSSSSSGESSQSAAAALARTCSGFVAPAITEATAGCDASPAIASSSRECPWSDANSSSASTWSNASSVSRSEPSSRDPAGGGSPRRYLPVSSPLASGKKGMNATPSSAQRGRTSASGARSSRL